MNLAESLTQKVGPLPAWLWALGVGVALYLLAHRHAQSSARSLTTNTTSPFAGGQGIQLGSPAALVGPVLQLNPMASNGINSQQGAVIASTNAPGSYQPF